MAIFRPLQGPIKRSDFVRCCPGGPQKGIFSAMKKTPLNEVHVQLGGRMVPFAGWEMPVQYKGIREEHEAVRKNVGLFDVSHMGEIRVRGPKAVESLQWLTTNDLSKLTAGKAQYSLLPNAEGGVVDDLIVYCLVPNEDYLLCVNAANTDKDWAHIQKNNKGAELKNESSEWGQIAVQGPKASQLLKEVFDLDWANFESFSFLKKKFAGVEVLIARTGYTGEQGVEIFVPAAATVKLWSELFEKGKKYGVEACGLGARDTLRTEMKYSLYGQEIDDTTNPYMAGLGWVVKPAAKDFLGKSKIMAEKEKGLTRSLIGFKLVDKGVARPGYGVLDAQGKSIGRVTSGTFSPSLEHSIGIAYVDLAFAKPDTEIWLDIRGRPVKSTVVKTPFWNPA